MQTSEYGTLDGRIYIRDGYTYLESSRFNDLFERDSDTSPEEDWDIIEAIYARTLQRRARPKPVPLNQFHTEIPRDGHAGRDPDGGG